MAKAKDEQRIGSVSDFVAKIEVGDDAHRAFYRGQGFDRPLLPAVARQYRQEDLVSLERSYLNEFKRRAAAFGDFSRMDEWDLLTFAQHAGAPTRLLDWTRNPLAALWFALAYGGDSPVVWRVTTLSSDFVSDSDRAKSPFELRRTRFFLPSHVSGRVSAQESCFSVHRFWKSRSTSKRTYASLDSQSSFKDRLTKFVISPARSEIIIAQLDRLGINFANLFPDVEGLARHLALRYKFQVRDISFRRMISLVQKNIDGGGK